MSRLKKYRLINVPAGGVSRYLRGVGLIVIDENLTDELIEQFIAQGTSTYFELVTTTANGKANKAGESRGTGGSSGNESGNQSGDAEPDSFAGIDANHPLYGAKLVFDIADRAVARAEAEAAGSDASAGSGPEGDPGSEPAAERETGSKGAVKKRRKRA